MKFLVDENLHADLVAWLRARGHDVVYAAEVMASEPDEVILRRARGEGRIVVTDDKDFGDLVVHRRLAATGVLLLRLGSPAWSQRLDRLQSVWPSVEARLAGGFVVISDRRVRIRAIPPTVRGGGP